MRAAFGRRYEHDGWLGCLYEGFSSEGKVKKTTRSLTRMVEAGKRQVEFGLLCGSLLETWWTQTAASADGYS